MSVLQIILLGVVGLFVGGFLGRLLFGSGDGYVQPVELDQLGRRRRDRAAAHVLIRRRSRTPACTVG